MKLVKVKCLKNFATLANDAITLDQYELEEFQFDFIKNKEYLFVECCESFTTINEVGGKHIIDIYEFPDNFEILQELEV